MKKNPFIVLLLVLVLSSFPITADASNDLKKCSTNSDREASVATMGMDMLDIMLVSYRYLSATESESTFSEIEEK